VVTSRRHGIALNPVNGSADRATRRPEGDHVSGPRAPVAPGYRHDRLSVADVARDYPDPREREVDVTSPSNRRPGTSRRSRRDRHGRGLRGRLVPATVPLARTKSEIFDELVLDTVEMLERRFATELAGVEFAVEDVPPDLNVYDSDVLEDGEVPLARLLPGRPERQEMPPRIVLYRRPLEFRALDREDLADLVHDVIIEQVANLLGMDPDELT
jgi:predicted Zn-dependent protease with MMP-like domain